MNRYPRDMHGYGSTPPAAQWPHNAAIAIQIVVNYEEGGERCLLHGDAESEAFLSEIPAAAPWHNQRHWNMESLYEYGARAGFWRLYTLLTQHKIPTTVFGVTTALERSPAQLDAMLKAEWEVACHGLKWIDYKDMPPEEERQHIREAAKRHKALTGQHPHGWYTGRCSMNTIDLVAQETDTLYQSDSYADDLPYWLETQSKPQLIIPYTLDANDMRFATQQGFNSGTQFYTYLKDSFDALYQEGLGMEGRESSAKMMSIGLHCRLIGRPGRIIALKRFIEYAQSHERVWFARRVDIARHWRRQHPHPATPPLKSHPKPHTMTKTEFLSHFGSVFEHSPWIAEAVFNGEMGPAHNHAAALHAALAQVFRTAPQDKRLKVLNAHPDLAGRLAAAGRLTKESTQEQKSAGLNMLTDKERQNFTKLNDQYKEKFNFPFIIAVKGLNKTQILKAFQNRLQNTRQQEFNTACQEVEKIARLRLDDILPS